MYWFSTLVSAYELLDARNNPFRNPFRNMTTHCIGNESVEIRYVNGRFVAGTSAASPGVPRHMQDVTWKRERDSYPLDIIETE